MTMKAALGKHWDKFWIESDLVRAIQNPNFASWSIRSQWLNCLSNFKNRDFMITHIYIEGNVCVDAFVSLGLINRNITLYNHVIKEASDDFLLNKFGFPILRLVFL